MVRQHLLAVALAGTLASAIVGMAVPAMAQAPKQDDPWPGLVSDVFHDKKMAADDHVVQLSAPARAEDAAVVPMIIHIGQAADGAKIAKVTLVIDSNPAPVAAVYQIGPKAGVTMIETRVRVDQYTNVHAVAETTDGRLFVSTAYVKAAGGCSAPAGKDEAKANIGQMRLRLLPNPPAANGGATLREVQLMIRHPNNSGMQMDQITHYYIPALYVNKVKITQGDDLVLAIDGGISISQDPNFRFIYVSNGAASMRVDATDSSGKEFKKDWPLNQAM
jgi:sulfur-oxidizing protein SoxY